MDCDGRVGIAGVRAPAARRAARRVVATWRALVRLSVSGFLLATVAAIACALALGWHVFRDRRGLPDLEPFLRFEVPVTGHVYDSRGHVLAEVARERRRMVSYDDLPPVVQNALLRKVEEVRIALWLERELEQRLGSKRRAKEAILARYAISSSSWARRA